MPTWLQDLRHRAQNRSNSLAHHIPFYQKWCLRRELRRQEKDLPKPLKPRRAHQNLSTMAVNTISNAQPECLLLSRLPAELRLQIYEEVFRDDGYKKPSHISIVKGRLAALPMCADCGCENHDDEIELQRLSILKTCRRIYSEAITVLYSTWDFHIRDMDTIIHLSRTILPQRFATIRSLYLQLSVCFNHEPYLPLESGWEIITTEMTGLRNFMVGWNYYLCPNHPSISSGSDGPRERSYLEPLLSIRGLEYFKMEYTCYSSQEEVDEMEGDAIDVSAEALAYKEHLREVVCTPRGQVLDGTESEGEDEAESEVEDS